MMLINISTILLIVVVGYAQSEYTELYNHPGVPESLTKYKADNTNSTVKYSDIKMFMDFRNNLHQMVDSVSWKKEVKVWADTGLVVMNKPITALAGITSEVGEHSEYKSWVKEVKYRVTGKLIIAYKDAHVKSLKYLQDQLMQKLKYHTMRAKKTRATQPMQVVKITAPQDNTE